MKLISVTETNVKQGQLLVIDSSSGITPYTVKKVKVTESDGTEIILDMKKNIYFNLKMYLEGKSWVKEACIIEK